jgi:hypothetical protein
MEIISSSYAPWQAALYGGDKNGRSGNVPFFDERLHYQTKVQPFRAGGYEVTARLIDAQKLADIQVMPRCCGTRVDTGERSIASLERSRQRAKQMVRYRIKDMGGNRLCTLTIRQGDEIGYMTPDEWAVSFQKFVRLLRRAGLLSDYVAILEPHKIGLARLESGDAVTSEGAWNVPLHLHFVTRSVTKMPVNLMRKCWALASGRDGNIDVQWMRTRNDDDAAIDRCASYATKYITKGWGDFERFNKKHYWAAGEKLLEKGRGWLRARTVSDAFQEVMQKFAISGALVGDLISKRRIFIFPDGSGFWMNVRPSSLAEPPPF